MEIQKFEYLQNKKSFRIKNLIKIADTSFKETRTRQTGSNGMKIVEIMVPLK